MKLNQEQYIEKVKNIFIKHKPINQLLFFSFVDSKFVFRFIFETYFDKNVESYIYQIVNDFNDSKSLDSSIQFNCGFSKVETCITSSCYIYSFICDNPRHFINIYELDFNNIKYDFKDSSNKIINIKNMVKLYEDGIDNLNIVFE